MRWVELAVGFGLVVLAAAVIARPRYRSGRLLLGVAVAAFAVGLLGVFDGLSA